MRSQPLELISAWRQHAICMPPGVRAAYEQCAEELSAMLSHYNQPNDVVACVSCKQPVRVTALNAIRCELCVNVLPSLNPKCLMCNDKHQIIMGKQGLQPCPRCTNLGVTIKTARKARNDRSKKG